MKTKYRFSLSIGTSSLIMIFAVLCLTLFATLSLLMAKHEMNLSAKYAANISAYYGADTQATQNLQSIDSWLTQASQLYGNENDRKAFIEQQCIKFGFNCDVKDDILYIAFSEDINEVQSLKVILKITSVTNKTYDIIQWKQANIGEFIVDDTIDVYK